MPFYFFLILFSSFAHAIPTHFTERANAIGNICQTCFPKIVKWGGKPHCAPAAVSNSLVWLSEHGFPSLQPFHGNDRDVNQARLVDELGKEMETSPTEGTSPWMAMTGLKKFLAGKNIRHARLSAEGWRSVPRFVKVKSRQANLDWIKEGTLGRGSVWILIGWYTRNANTGNFNVYDGHWMTVVGYGKDREGNEDPNILVVHDPAERAERKNYYARVTKLQYGTIDGERPAKGELQITGDVLLKPNSQMGIIQGAYRLEL